MLIDDFISAHAGTEQHLLFLLDKLPRSECALHFVVLSGIRHADPSMFSVPPIVLRRNGESGAGSVAKRVRRLATFIKSHNVDVVHAFCPVSEIFAVAATRLARKGRVIGVRRNIGYWHTRSTIWRARCVARCRLSYVANCEAVKESCRQREWISASRIQVIMNPLREDRRREGLANVVPRESLGIQNGEHVVGIVANVRPVKDHATFLQAARLVLDEMRHTRFVVVGQQEQGLIEELRALSQQLGIERQVTWCGAIENPYSLIPHFDAGVLSSVSEGFPNTLVEYAAAGLPAVATDVGGTREILLDQQTGFVVPPRSPELMAERICCLLRDANLRHRMGEDARHRAEACLAEEQVLRQYLELYQAATLRECRR
jgi:glycosyltransferase involved in cell wall biosynthesis